MATRGAGQPKAKTGKGTSRSGRGTHSDDSPSKPSDKGSYRCFFCIANPSLYQSKDLECCTGRGFSTLALLLYDDT